MQRVLSLSQILNMVLKCFLSNINVLYLFCFNSFINSCSFFIHVILSSIQLVNSLNSFIYEALCKIWRTVFHEKTQLHPFQHLIGNHSIFVTPSVISTIVIFLQWLISVWQRVWYVTLWLISKLFKFSGHQNQAVFKEKVNFWPNKD